MKEFVMQETEELTIFGSVWKRYEPVVELIRCKNCKHRHDSINCSMYSEGMDTEDDWFCADGKHKEGD